MAKLRRILAIDDDPECLEVYRRFFSRHGFEVMVASRSVDGLLQARSLKPDVIILDIHMPGLDGVAAAEILMKTPDTSGIPIILVTGKPLLDSVLDGLGRGLKVSAVVRKPEDLDVLLRSVRQALSSPAGNAQRGASDDANTGRCLSRGSMLVDLAAREVLISGNRVSKLPARRFELLVALLRREGPVNAEALSLDLWRSADHCKAVQMTVARLRDDLKSVPGIQIETTPQGYVLAVVSEASLRA